MATEINALFDQSPIVTLGQEVESRLGCIAGDASADRRSKTRFRLNLEVTYHVIRRGKAALAGVGLTSDIASGGVAFSTDTQLPIGTNLQLAISWPALLHGVCPMKLVASGRVIRSNGREAVCELGRYEFRTKGSGASPLLSGQNYRPGLSAN
jgi:hypothetical protein